MSQQRAAPLAKALADRIAEIPTVEREGIQVIPNFGMFIDTHRDQPHVGSFHDDIHRGQCRPTKVDYAPAIDSLYNPETKEVLDRHEKHMFLTEEYWSHFLQNYFIEHGVDPRDTEGILPTSHFRDARAKKYDIQSFRQIAMDHWLKASLNGSKP